MTTNTKATPITPDEVRRLGGRLIGTLLSGTYCQAGDPASPGVRPVVFEEFGLWRERDYERLRAVLRATGATRIHALEYQSPDGQAIEFTGGVSIAADVSFEEYTAIGEDVGFALNGTEYHLCDDTATWTIGTTVDVQFLVGSEAFFRSWYANAAERDAAIDGLREFLSGPKVKPAFKRMLDYLRP